MLGMCSNKASSACDRTRSRVSCFSIVLPGIVVFLISAGLAHAAIPASERAVLLNLYAYTDGADWDPQTGWNGPPGTECTWYGITCDAQRTTVTGINLAGVGLYGSLPSLTTLTNLETFDIHQTATGGIGAYNSLFGPIPPLNGLSNLKTFVANNTFFSGGVPNLAGMTNLVHFECTRCQLSGSIPSLSGLIHLAYFDVDNNQLNGSIPALTGLASLAYFEVATNHLSGPIPDLSGLNALTTFDATENLLRGGVPDLIDLPNLQYFGGGSLLDGTLGKLVGLPKLIEFGVDDGLLTGTIPPLEGIPSLQEYYVPGNRLTGGIPNLSGLNNLTAFSASFNQLTGAVPAPPPSLVNARANSSGGAALCPNLLTPASNPPSGIDVSWDTATGTTPWSQQCVPNPEWPSFIDVFSNLNPSLSHEPVTFTALVGGMNPTGTVTFTTRPDAPNNTQATTLCDSVPLQNQLATCTTDSFSARTSNVIIASYSGDANNAPADNTIGTIFGNVLVSTIDQLVSGSITETATANSAQIGQPVDLSAVWIGGDDNDTLTFYDGRAPLCSNVPVTTVQSQQIGHCVAQFATAGPHSLTVQSNGDSSLPLIENVVAATPFDANQFALTGSWYNPPTSGQGLEIEVYPDFNGTGTGLLFGGWFTYDTSGNQQWVTLQGNLASSHGASYTLEIDLNTGGNFNAQPITNSVVDGSATLTFYDCAHAALTYKFNDGRSGTIPYVRLTSPSACSTAVPAVAPTLLPANYDDVLHSGAWYDPNTAGQGLMIDVVPAQTTFFVAWYTYAPQTEGLTGLAGQRWFTLADNNYTPGNLNLLDVPILSTSGGVFNQPTNVNDVQVGSANVTFTSCNAMTLQYTFIQGEFAGLSGTIDEYAIGPVNGCR